MRKRIAEKEVREIAAKAAGTLLSYPWKVWFWGDSIGLEGLLNATELTGDAQYRGFVYGLFKAWIAREQFRSERGSYGSAGPENDVEGLFDRHGNSKGRVGLRDRSPRGYRIVSDTRRGTPDHRFVIV